MKQNRKLAFVLLPIAFTIWGYIAYQLIFKFEDADFNSPGIIKKVDTENAIRTGTDTFSLLLNYPDPFLMQKVSRPAYRGAITRQQSQIRKEIPPAASVFPIVLPWPSIEYNGLIENQQKKLKVAMIQIAGQEYLLKQMESQQGVQIVRIFRDSIELQFQGQKRFQRRQ